MKKNLRNFDNPDEYIVQTEIVETVEGLQIAAWQLRDWLLRRIGEFESDEAANAEHPVM